MKQSSGYEKTLETIKSAKTMPPMQAIETLVNCAKKGYPLAAVKAVQALSIQNHPSVIPSLIDLYEWADDDPHKHDKSCDIRIAIAEILGDMASSQAIDALRKAVRTIQIVRLGPTPEDIAIGLRATAAIALAKVDSDSLYELSLLLFDEEPNIPTSAANRPFAKAPVRKAAAQAIGILGNLGGMPLLAVKLKYPKEEAPEVLAECLESLIAMRPPYLLEITKPYLFGADEYLSAITALSLAENLGMDVLELLLQTLDKLHGEAKEAIVVAISVIRSSEIRWILFDLLNDPSPYVRRGAAKGIKSYLNDEVKEKLHEMSQTDPDKFVRREAEL